MNDNQRWQKNRELVELLGYHVGKADYYNPGGEYEADAVLKPNGTPLQLYADTGLHALTLDEQWQLPALDFYGSLDTCVSVLPEGYATGKSYDFKISALLEVRGYVCTVFEDTPTFGVTDRWSGDGDTRAAALASAVLNWARTRRR